MSVASTEIPAVPGTGERPEMIVVSQNLLGGGASFHRNMLAHFPKDPFDIHCIFLNPVAWNGSRALDITLEKGDEIFSYGNESVFTIAKRLAEHISNREGVVVSNLEEELICLDLFRKPGKTVYFICHDDGFLDIAVRYQSIIDVYITHNIAVHQALKDLIRNRDGDFYFIQHGVRIPDYKRETNAAKILKIVFLARHYIFKGLMDLPEIDLLLQSNGCRVEWMILGDGPERGQFIEKVRERPNFSLAIPRTAGEVIEMLKTQDVFILPSRKDGLPVALLESMSVGCVPVIANFSEGIRKVVTEEVGFVLPVGDNAGFAETIQKLDRDRKMLAYLSAACVEKVKREFDISKQALEYFRLYTEYRQLKRKSRFRMTDVRRRLGYYPFFSKLSHLSSRIKARVKTGKAEAPLSK